MSLVLVLLTKLGQLVLRLFILDAGNVVGIEQFFQLLDFDLLILQGGGGARPQLLADFRFSQGGVGGLKLALQIFIGHLGHDLAVL